MLGKLFFAFILLGLVLLMMVKTKRPPQPKQGAPKPKKPIRKGMSDHRLAAYLFIGLVVLSSIAMLTWQWQDRQQNVVVTVIDTKTGKEIRYRSKYSLVDERSFETLDGRQVRVADTERIELRDADDD